MVWVIEMDKDEKVPKKIYDNEFITTISGLKIIAWVWLVMEYQTVVDIKNRYVQGLPVHTPVNIKIGVRCVCSNPERAEQWKEFLEERHREKFMPEERFLKYSVEKIWVDHLLGSTMEGDYLYGGL